MYTKNLGLNTSFTIMEHFFCISRPYLIEERRTRIMCEAILASVSITVIAAFIIDLFYSDVGTGFKIFECLTGLELLWLALAARFGNKTSKSMKRLDEKYPLHEECLAKLNTKTNNIAALSLLAFVCDLMCLHMLKLNNSSVIFLCVVFAAHDAELAYFSLLIEKLIARLEVLKSLSPNTGCRAYGYLLIATSYLSEQITPRLLLLLGTTLFTTVIYEFFLILADAKTVFYLSLYLIWRESKAMYSLWLMCSAVARSDNTCKDLALYLIGRLTMDKNLNKNPLQYNLIERWYSVVTTQQPRYISGTFLSISLSTPILVIDLSINYMLIIVQMYQAYK